jgi:RNA polymerase sigma factor (sigma-70 family)
VLLVCNEAEIIEGCRKNNPEFQKIVYEKYAPKMMAICMRYSGNYEEARDLMHDGFIKVFMNFKSYRQESNLDSWITRIMINNTLSYIRTKIRKEKSEKNYKRENEIEASHSKVESWLEKFSLEEINEAIMKLPFAKRTVFNLYVIDDYSHKDIARELGISIGTSKSNLSRAKETLRDLLLMKLNRLR